MTGKFDNIFAGIGMWCTKDACHCLVDNPAPAVADITKRKGVAPQRAYGLARGGPEDFFCDADGLRACYPYDGDGASCVGARCADGIGK